VAVVIWGLNAVLLFRHLSQPSIAGEIPLIGAPSQLPDAKRLWKFTLVGGGLSEPEGAGLEIHFST